MMTGHANVDLSVAAMKLGAIDFLEKPVQPNEIVEAFAAASGRLEPNPKRRPEDIDPDAVDFDDLDWDAVRSVDMELDPALVERIRAPSPAAHDARWRRSDRRGAPGCGANRGEVSGRAQAV